MESSKKINDNFKKKVKNKTVLITGGTGSFGNTVVKKLLEYSPKKIIIFSRDEKKQDDMRTEYNSPLLKFVIGDVRDKESVERVVEGVDFIFHAAALKQVPTCEFFPVEAVKTNILGTSNVLSAAVRHNVKRVVILSTDKAVYPINAMGMSKALMEKTMIAAAKNYPVGEGKKTVFCGVRYGNVLYSRGSVIPHFINQIKKGEKLSVTKGEMTRFLLPLKDAVDLVMFALLEGESGYMYVRKSPACSMETLAQAICKLFKYSKGYKEVGARAGEKMAETLVSREEKVRVKEVDKYYKIPPESQGLDYDKYLDIHKNGKVNVEKIDPYTSDNTNRLNVDQVVDLLLKLPEIRQIVKLH